MMNYPLISYKQMYDLSIKMCKYTKSNMLKYNYLIMLILHLISINNIMKVKLEICLPHLIPLIIILAEDLEAI